MRSSEVYNNVFTNGGGILALQYRGGTTMIFSNQFYGFGDAIQEAYYKSCKANHCYIFVNGEGLPGEGFVLSFAKNPTNGQTITLTNCDGNAFYFGYTFVSSYQNTAGYVVIGSDLAHTLTNLYNAVNLGTGSGTTYAVATTLNSSLQAYQIGANSITLTNMLNGSAPFGYPANQQPGVLFSYPHTTMNKFNPQVVFGCYNWGNTLAGKPVGMSLQDTGAECGSYITNLLKPGRDYYNDVIPDMNVYTPLVYPHPLQAMEASSSSDTMIAPPGGLQATPTPGS